jgi:hypothetical protein
VRLFAALGTANNPHQTISCACEDRKQGGTQIDDIGLFGDSCDKSWHDGTLIEKIRSTRPEGKEEKGNPPLSLEMHFSIMWSSYGFEFLNPKSGSAVGKMQLFTPS